MMLRATLAALCIAIATGSVIETAKKNGCNELVNIIKAAGLRKDLEKASNVTLFAPSDAAISAIPPEVMRVLRSNKTLLQDVLKFHVLPVAVKSTALKNDELVPTLAGSSKLRINIYKNGSVVTAEGSKVSKPDLMASNGVVHIIDKVIYPLPNLTIPLYLTFNKDLTSLSFLTYQAKLGQNLTAQNLTLFAPSNEAFKKLPAQEYSDLLMNKTLLTAVLTMHVINGTAYSSGLTDGQKVMSLQGSELAIKIATEGVTINGSKVTTADISTINGVIHVIDTVLFPPKTLSPPPHL